MISTLTSSSAGPVAGYIATGKSSSRYINVFSYRSRILAPTFLPARPNDSTSVVYRLAWNEYGNFLVVATADKEGVKFFSRSGSAFTASSVPSNINCASGDAAISTDGSYVAAVSGEASNNNFIGRIWHNNAGTLTNLTTVGSFTFNSRSCAVSSDGAYVAFLGQSSPTFLRIKIRAGSGNSATYSDMAIASQPSSGGSTNPTLSGLAFSPDDTYLAVSPANQAHQTIYKFNSGTSLYEQLASPFVGALPDASVRGCTFSAQGDFLAIATSSKTFFYERSGDTFTNVANVTSGQRGGFHPSGNFYITGSGQIYRKINATTWTAQGTALTAGSAAAFSPYIT
jgi:hypothetical protein